MKGRQTVFIMRSAVLVLCLLVAAGSALAAGPPGSPGEPPRLDHQLAKHAQLGVGASRVIIEFEDGAPEGFIAKGFGAQLGRKLRSFKGTVALVPNSTLEKLARHPLVRYVHWDRPTGGELHRAASIVGARYVQDYMGMTGAGVGVAVIDSGITSWHDDLQGVGLSGERVAAFVDFVNGHSMPYDDNGHGTHVAGIIAGSGYDSSGDNKGIAPGATLISLKVLNAHSAGYMSDVIAAFDWAVANRVAYNIRVINLSVGAAVTRSYRTDPLTLAAKAAVDAGIVVVAAAGNFGMNLLLQTQYGGITAPGNAPWVLTVGAYNHMGTLSRYDDVMARFSSRGPTYLDYQAKPDIVAPGVGIVSLSDPASTFYATKTALLLGGSVSTAYLPYLSLSGTSMAAPIVTGTVALMLQANPALTPNAVKGILEYTAELRRGYDLLTQGAGFVNTRGAVRLAQFFRTATPGAIFPKGTSYAWARHIIWGNRRVSGAMILPTGNAWATNVVWGAERDAHGDNIVWGTACPAGSDCESIKWGTSATRGENIVWGTEAPLDNIVWGTSYRSWWGESIVWGTSSDNIVWGVSFTTDDNIVWGTADSADNIVWGTDCGGADCENIVWGVSTLGADGENIVWGTAENAENIVWGTSAGDDNIVWGTAAGDDNITWGSNGDDNIVWGVNVFDEVVFGELSGDEQALIDGSVYDDLFSPPVTSPPTSGGSTEGGL